MQHYLALEFHKQSHLLLLHQNYRLLPQLQSLLVCWPECNEQHVQTILQLLLHRTSTALVCLTTSLLLAFNQCCSYQAGSSAQCTVKLLFLLVFLLLRSRHYVLCTLKCLCGRSQVREMIRVFCIKGSRGALGGLARNISSSRGRGAFGHPTSVSGVALNLDLLAGPAACSVCVSTFRPDTQT